MCRNIKSHVCVLVISMTEAMMLCWCVLHQFSYTSPAYIDSLTVCMKTTWRSYRVYWNVVWSLHVGLEDLSVTLFWWGSLLNTSEMRWDQQRCFCCLRKRLLNAWQAQGEAVMHGHHPGGRFHESPRLPLCQSLNQWKIRHLSQLLLKGIFIYFKNLSMGTFFIECEAMASNTESSSTAVCALNWWNWFLVSFLLLFVPWENKASYGLW